MEDEAGFPDPNIALKKKEPIPDLDKLREVDVSVYNEIVATLTVPQESSHAPPDFQSVEYGEFLFFGFASEERWVADLREFIGAFNSAARYGDMVYCPRSSRIVHDGVTKLLRSTMRARGLIWRGACRIRGREAEDERVYHAWKVEQRAREICFDLMDGKCTRTPETCWFSHDIPHPYTDAYAEALERKEAYLRKKAARTLQA
jgi:hypothetical protein